MSTPEYPDAWYSRVLEGTRGVLENTRGVLERTHEVLRLAAVPKYVSIVTASENRSSVLST